MFDSTKLTSFLKKGVNSEVDTNLFLTEVDALLRFVKDSTDTSIIKNKESQKYPIDHDGYAVAIDHINDPEKLIRTWRQFGFVVCANVCKESSIQSVLTKINSLQNEWSSLNLNKNVGPVDNSGTQFISRGFFELYHDNSLAQIRQSESLFVLYSLLWGTTQLWTTFDRIGLKPPSGESAKGLDLHIDQNPLVHPDFTTIQGVLALTDCPAERGTFVVVPNSIRYFKDYANFIPKAYKGEFVPTPDVLLNQFRKEQQIIPLRKGNIVLWDSRTTHANSDNISNKDRIVCYIASGLARENDYRAIATRLDCFNNAKALNDRQAYLHASKKPRYSNTEYLNAIRTKEELTPLGQCLYGLKKYGDLK